jgi:hypothetical protein
MVLRQAYFTGYIGSQVLGSTWKDQTREIRWMGHIGHMAQKRNAYWVLVGNPERNRPLGTSGHTQY